MGLLQFLDSCDLLLENIDSEDDDDDIISHKRGCYLGTLDHLNGCGENRWRTPDQSPRNHFDFDHEVPYETSQEARDRLLNHNDVLVGENRRLWRQLQEQPRRPLELSRT